MNKAIVFTGRKGDQTNQHVCLMLRKTNRDLRCGVTSEDPASTLSSHVCETVSINDTSRKHMIYTNVFMWVGLFVYGFGSGYVHIQQCQ